jgi:hypothetical protein
VTARLLLAATLLAAPASAGEPSAQQFLESIYRQYLGKDAHGAPLATPAEVRRYFDAPLAAQILRDRQRAARRGDVPALDGDPFVDAQDWELSDLQISVDEPAPGRAVGHVRFVNAGQRVEITLELVKSSGRWRIHEIRMPRGSLVELLRKPR